MSSLLKLEDELSIIQYDEPKHHKKSLHDGESSVEIQNMISKEGISQGGKIPVAANSVGATARHSVSISNSESDTAQVTSQVASATQEKEGERLVD